MAKDQTKPCRRPKPVATPPSRPVAGRPERGIRHAPVPANGAVAAISRLDATRWHIRPHGDRPGSWEIYLALDEASLLSVTWSGKGIAIRLDGDFSDGCVRNLGDCLIKAISEDAARIDVWLGRTETLSLEACPMFASFGRSLARQRLDIRLQLHGRPAVVRELTAAFRAGVGCAGKAKEVS